MARFGQALVRRLDAHSSPLTQVHAFRLGLDTQHGFGPTTGLGELQRYFLPRLTNVRVLSLEGRLCHGLFGNQQLRHLALHVRWSRDLLTVLTQVNPGSLESLCLEQWHNSEEWHYVLGEELTFDISGLKLLKRVALTRMGPCQLLLPPQAFKLCICAHLFTWPQPAAVITSLRLVMEVFRPPFTDRTAEMLRELPALVSLRELELAVKFCDPMAAVWLSPELLAQLTKLASLRLYPTWRTGECKGAVGGIVIIQVPPLLKLRTLHIVAPTVRLGFQNARASAAELRDFKVTAAAFESLHGIHINGFACMRDVVGPHLAPGLSVRTCAIEGEEGQESSCVWINKLQGDMLQAYLVDDPCQCHACWSCLQRDRALLAGAQT